LGLAVLTFDTQVK